MRVLKCSFHTNRSSSNRKPTLKCRWLKQLSKTNWSITTRDLSQSRNKAQKLLIPSTSFTPVHILGHSDKGKEKFLDFYDYTPYRQKEFLRPSIMPVVMNSIVYSLTYKTTRQWMQSTGFSFPNIECLYQVVKINAMIKNTAGPMMNAWHYTNTHTANTRCKGCHWNLILWILSNIKFLGLNWHSWL